jgi:hypothetical protein
MSGLKGRDYWRLCDELSIVQAASLICLPSDYDGPIPCPDEPPGFAATMAALTHAILSGRLKATIRRRAWETGWYERPDDNERHTSMAQYFPEDPPDPDRLSAIDYEPRVGSAAPLMYRADPDWAFSTVRVEILRDWLSLRGIKTGFFFPQADEDTPDFLNPKHPRYSPKLAAAVHAWQANPDPKGKTPKQALIKWLNEHAAEYGLSDDEGRPNDLGIEECAKVANWQPGGPARTPGT